MISKEKKFIMAIAVQVMIIFSIIIFKLAVLTGGNDILLRIEPTDPRDPFRGDHLTFSYNISNLNYYLFSYHPIRNGDTVYVPLKKQGKYFTAGFGIQKRKPINNVKIFIKGKILSSYNNKFHIVYGIEDYFIPEGAGRDFNFLNQELTAKVSVDENGNSVLKKIYVNDKPWP